MKSKRKQKKKQKKQKKKEAAIKDVFDALRFKYACLNKAEWWWLFDDSLEVIGRELSEKNFVVLDHFLGIDKAQKLHSELVRAYNAGKLPETKHAMIGCPRMEPGALAGGKTGSNLTYRMNAVRGDHVAWFSGQEEACSWELLPVYLQRVDTLVSELGSIVEELKGSGSFRSNAMATCYPGSGSHYVRHCDNTTEVRNGRKVTALYYANPKWKEGDGGELRIFAPQSIGQEKEFTKVCDIEPIADRVVLFFSDERVPHEVLPALAQRFAVTVWYFDKDEKEEANKRKKDESLREEEEKKIQKEIAKFQAKYGEDAEIVCKGKDDSSNAIMKEEVSEEKQMASEPKNTPSTSPEPQKQSGGEVDGVWELD